VILEVVILDIKPELLSKYEPAFEQAQKSFQVGKVIFHISCKNALKSQTGIFYWLTGKH